MSIDDVKRARRPLSYVGASDNDTCEGWQASPSNPTKKQSQPPKGELDAVVVFRCTAAEKQALIEKAKRAGLPFAHLMREALGLADSRRRKPVPRVDPELIRSVGRIGSNVNQIARWLNAANAMGKPSNVDALVLAAQLVAIERSLNAIITQSVGVTNTTPSQVDVDDSSHDCMSKSHVD